jgi:hypothetical protein
MYFTQFIRQHCVHHLPGLFPTSSCDEPDVYHTAAQPMRYVPSSILSWKPHFCKYWCISYDLCASIVSIISLDCARGKHVMLPTTTTQLPSRSDKSFRIWYGIPGFQEFQEPEPLGHSVAFREWNQSAQCSVPMWMKNWKYWLDIPVPVSILRVNT